MYNSTYINALIYLIGSLFLASTLGLGFLRLLDGYNMPKQSKFLFGFSMLPYVLGVYMLVITLIPARLPNIVYVVIPYILAVLCLLRIRNGAGGFDAWIVWTDLGENISPCFEPVLIVFVTAFGTGFFKVFNVWYAVAGAILASVTCTMLARALENSGASKNFSRYDIIRMACGAFSALAIQLAIPTIKVAHGGLKKLIMTGLVFSLTLVLGGVEVGAADKLKQGKVAAKQRAFFRIALSLAVISIELVRCADSHPRRILGLAVLCFFFGGALFWSERKHRALIPPQKLSEYGIILVSAVVLLEVIKIISIEGLSEVTGSDAIQYLSEALDYTKTMAFGTMNDWKGSASGSLVSNIHHPAWPAYLSNALLYAPTGREGFPHDGAVRMAYALSHFYLIAGIAAFGGLFEKRFVPLLSAAMIYINDRFFDLIYSSSRDSYRITAILLFFGLLLCKPEQSRFKELLIAFAGAAMVMIGHPINAITAIAIVISYSLYLLLSRDCPVTEIAKYYLASAFGALVGSLQMLDAYLKTGSLTGRWIDVSDILAGTTYYDTYMAGFNATIGNNLPYWDRLWRILLRDRGFLSIPAAIAAVVFLIVLMRKREFKRPELVLTLVVIIQNTLFTDVISWSGTPYSMWCVRNARYTMQLYIFWAVMIAFAVWHLLNCQNGHLSAVITPWLGISVMCGMIVFSYLAASEQTSRSVRDNWGSSYSEVNAAIDALEPRKMLLDNFNMNYYLDDRGLSWWSAPMDAIRHADTDRDLYRELKAKNIGAILITNPYYDLYWKNTEMERFLKSDYIVDTITTGENGRFTIYLLEE